MRAVRFTARPNYLAAVVLGVVVVVGVEVRLWPGAVSEFPGPFWANVNVGPPSTPAHVPGTATPFTSRA
jgi:hypothetical protein